LAGSVTSWMRRHDVFLATLVARFATWLPNSQNHVGGTPRGHVLAADAGPEIIDNFCGATDAASAAVARNSSAVGHPPAASRRLTERSSAARHLVGDLISGDSKSGAVIGNTPRSPNG
jgi:hypothetical protein